MREAISKTLTSSSLEWDDSEHEGAVDKLTAFSYSDRMGTLLWRVKYSNDASAYKPVVYLLAKSLPRLNRSIAIKTSEQALREWLAEFCTSCSGSKVARDGDKVIDCPVCHGVGTRRYTDSERAAFIGANMSKNVDYLLNVIGGIDISVAVKTRLRLEK
ncbi:MAG TPA: zinc finger-like domain-containing protein [Vitreimonas sp.]|nr:zinc finger-like domain-containing protein [Vitreimonas sp.]